MGRMKHIAASDNDSVISDEPEYSDDEDVSWKVRRAAAKSLDAVVNTQRHHLTELYTNLAPLLIQRLKEREDNVKTEVNRVTQCALVEETVLLQIFTVVLSMLKQTRLALPQTHVLSTTASVNVPNAGIHTVASVAGVLRRSKSPDTGVSTGPLLSRIHSISTAIDRLSSEERQLYDQVLQMQPALMRAVQRQLNDKYVALRESFLIVRFSGKCAHVSSVSPSSMVSCISCPTRSHSTCLCCCRHSLPRWRRVRV